MGWYEDALEYKEYWDNRQSQDPNEVKLESEDEVQNLNVNDITKLTITSFYKGQLPWLGQFENLEEVRIYQFCSWEYVEQITSNNIKVIYANIDDDTMPKRLKFKNLEQLEVHLNEVKVTPLETLARMSRTCDFTGIPKLKKLKVYRWDMDYSSINTLEHLETLIVSNTHLVDLKWLQLKKLKELRVYGNIENIDGIEMLSDLEILDLSHNKINDFTPICELRNLNNVNLYNNPVKEIGDIRNKLILELVIDGKDRDIALLKSIAKSTKEEAVRRLAFWENQDLNGLHPFRRKRLELPYKERLESEIALTFEVALKEITPFKSNWYEYSLDYRSKYLQFAFDEYPFLRLNERTKSLFGLEVGFSKCFLSEFSPGILIYCNKDIYRVVVETVKGNGKIKIRFNDKNRYWKKVEEQIHNNWDRFLPEHSKSEYDINVNIQGLYQSEESADFGLPILIGLKSFLERNPVKPATVISGELNKEGKLKNPYLNKSVRKALAQMKCKNIVFYDKKKESYEYETMNQYPYNDVNSLLECCLEQPISRIKEPLEDLLQRMIKKHGKDLLDKNKLSALIKDYCYEYRKEANVLILLAEQGIIKAITETEVIDSKFIYKYKLIMNEEYGIVPELVEDMINKWCYCYGKKYLKKKMK